MVTQANKPTGLLSKVIGFVRGKDDASPGESTLSPDSRQERRDLVARKRRNLAVRHQEFAQLRQLRQAGVMAENLPSPVSSQLSSQAFGYEQGALKSTQTLRKIDVIEAQMSRQWWGDKAGASSKIADSVQEGASLRAAPAAAGAPPGTAPASVQPIQPAQERCAVEFVPHADLEEPAILFAHGDAQAARTHLLEQLSQALSNPAAEPDTVARLWHAVLDLCRATGDEETFEPLAIDYAAHFGKSAPLWTSLPGQLGLAPLLGGAMHGAAATPAGRKGPWQSPAAVTTSTVAALNATVSRALPPWCMSWQRLHTVDEAALPHLTALLQGWADARGDYAWSYAGTLLQLLQRHTVVEDKQTNPQWWMLRLAVLRFLHRMEEYDEVALEYCITYEVSPPSWVPPLHQCLVELEGDLDPSTVLDALEQQTRQPGSTTAATATAAAAMTPVQGEGLWGILDGDIDAQLNAVSAKLVPGQPLEVDCSLLVRLDFVAAGSLLNWAAQAQSQGVALRFTHLHHLVAAFMTVLGVQEHAKLYLSPV